MLTKRSIFYYSDKAEISLPFYRYFSTLRNIFGGLCPHVFLVRGDIKSSVLRNELFQKKKINSGGRGGEGLRPYLFETCLEFLGLLLYTWHF